MNRRLGTVAIVLMALTALAGVFSFVFFSQPVPKDSTAASTPATQDSSPSTSLSPSQSSAPLHLPPPQGESSATNLTEQPQGTSTSTQNSSTNRATQKTVPAASTLPGRSIAEILQGADFSKPGERERVVAEIKAIEDQRRSAAIARAKELGLPIRIEKPGGGVSEVADIDENGQLLYRTTYNVNAAISTGANLVRQILPYNLSGNGIKVGVWDGGLVRNTHVEFSTSRVVHMNFTNLLDHATHVAGTIGASGISASAKGMAPAAAIDSYDWDSDNSEMTSAGAFSASDTSRIPISNHSYGLTTQTNDAAYMGRYTQDAANNDALLVNAPFYLPFWAAGNDQQRLNAKGGFQSITFEALAKNVLTIGNVNDAVSGGQRNPTNGTIWSTSSWGPSDDGRIKPDLVANGVGLYSPVDSSDTAYATFTGTSMASPNATGSAVLLAELYRREFSGELMRASLLKALLIHTADDLGNPGPDYKYGWGLINVKAAADMIHLHKYVAAHPKFFTNTITRQVTSRTHTFQWDGSSPIRATLCWTDPADVGQADDSRAPVLVRNLDLKVTAPNGTTIYQPYIMPFVGNWTDGSMNSLATTGKNNVDNVEQVYVAMPTQAGTYVVTVSLDGSISPFENSQPYSLVISGSSSGSSPTIGNIPDQAINLGNPVGPVPFTIADAETPANSLVLSATSSNSNLVPTNNIVWGGTGTNRTITITPANGVTGTSTITVTVHDGGFSASDSFVLTVNPVPKIAVEEYRGGDSSSASTYNDGVFVGRNGGNGFGSWSGSVAGAGGYYIGTTSARSRSFAIFSGASTSGNSAQATRLLGTSLAVGESLGVQLAYTAITSGGEIGVNFFSGGSFRLGLKFVGGSDQWVLNDGGSNFGTGLSWAGGTPLQVLFRRGVGNGYSIMLISGSQTYAGTGYTATSGVMSIDSVQFYSSAQGGGEHLGFDALTRGLDVAYGSPFDFGSVQVGSSGITRTFVVRNDGGSTLTSLTTSKSGSNPADFSMDGTIPASLTAGASASFTLNLSPTGVGTRSAVLSVTSNDSNQSTVSFNLDGIGTKAPAAVSLSGTNQTYNGSARSVSVSTTPSGLSNTVTYNGSSLAPTNVGTYTVVATVTDPNYEGSATNTLTISKATATITLEDLNQNYNGSARPVSVTTTPPNLSTTITYGGNATVPTDPGIYPVVAMINESNYEGSATATLQVSGVVDPEGDTNGDGIQNLIEYALATNSSGTILPVLSPPTNGVLTLTAIVRTNDSGLRYTAHGVTNLLDYADTNLVTRISGTPSADTNNIHPGFQKQEFNYTNSASRAFLKLTIQQQ